MKNTVKPLKKNLILILFLLVQFNSFSQNSFEVETGINVSFNSSDGKISFANPAFGPRIGINYLRRITGWLELETGLCYVQKIKKDKKESYRENYEGTQMKYITTNKYNYNHIELPLNLKFNRQNWFIYSGIYFSYPTSIFHIRKEAGRNAETGDLLWKEKKRTEPGINGMDPEFYSPLGAKSFDYGLNLGFGYDFNKIRLKVGTEYGFASKIPLTYLSVAYQFNSFNKIELKKTDTVFNQKNGLMLSMELSDLYATSFSSVIGFKEKKLVYFAGYERFAQVDYRNPAHRLKVGIQLYPHKNLGNLKFYYQAFLSNKWYDSVIYPKTTLFHLGSGFDYIIIKNLALGLQANLGYGKEENYYTGSGAIFDYQVAFTAKYFLLRRY